MTPTYVLKRHRAYVRMMNPLTTCTKLAEATHWSNRTSAEAAAKKLDGSWKVVEA